MSGPEDKIEKHFNKGVKALGGLHRKASWIGTRDCPDRFYMMPQAREPFHFWCEFKAPGEFLRSGQVEEVYRMTTAGCVVYLISSVKEADEILSALAKRC